MSSVFQSSDNQVFLSWEAVEALVDGLCANVAQSLWLETILPAPRYLKVFPVPRGGIHVAELMQLPMFKIGPKIQITNQVNDCDVIVDDIIDSGRTKKSFFTNFPGKPFFALVDKTKALNEHAEKWVQFPWETLNNQTGPEENIIRILQYIGENPNREGLKDTPSRVVRSFQEMYCGYRMTPESIIKIFKDDKSDEMIISKDIPFFSMCEHHMLPFIGYATIAYIPDQHIIGLSKLARLLECYARRLQIQERLTTQITSALDEYLKPKGSACMISAEHLCMSCRGVNKAGSRMVTSSLTGAFRDPAVRMEFLQLAKREK